MNQPSEQGNRAGRLAGRVALVTGGGSGIGRGGGAGLFQGRGNGPVGRTPRCRNRGNGRHDYCGRRSCLVLQRRHFA